MRRHYRRTKTGTVLARSSAVVVLPNKNLRMRE